MEVCTVDDKQIPEVIGVYIVDCLVILNVVDVFFDERFGPVGTPRRSRVKMSVIVAVIVPRPSSSRSINFATAK